MIIQCRVFYSSQISMLMFGNIRLQKYKCYYEERK